MTARTAFFFFLLPEVKGRSLEEIDELFENRVSVRNFPKYQCVSSERARETIRDGQKYAQETREERIQTIEAGHKTQ